MKPLLKTQPGTAQAFQFSLATLVLASLLACGGGSGTVAETKISGVVAYGAPMANAMVTVTDSRGNSRTATTDSEGIYTLNLTGLTAPFFLKASGAAGDANREYTALMVSAPRAGETGTANVTPLTHALVTMISSDGSSPDEFTDTARLKGLDAAKLGSALTHLQTALQDVLSDAGLPGNFDPLTFQFKADRTSAADILLDTIKVSVSDQGVALTNARLPASETAIPSPASTVTIKGTGTTPTRLGRPTVPKKELKGLDAFVADANACLALAPAERAAKDGAGNYILKGACSTVSGFDVANYKSNGYSLTMLWGNRLLESIPADSRLLPPEFLLFQDGGQKALIRLASTSPNGGRAYYETAAKGSDGVWRIVGNQLNYDARVEVSMVRRKDVSTYGLTLANSMTSSADAGKNVGRLDAYMSQLGFSFNPMGPNGSDVYAVRIKGPGLPDSGIVLARSSACGTSRHLAFYSNNGTLPAATLNSAATSATGNSWTLDVSAHGSAYKGTDFYNQLRGLSATGTASTSSSNPIAARAVDMKTIPEFAMYNWEVFTTASTSTAQATFSTPITTRPLAASEGRKQAWASLDDDARAYLDPTQGKELDTASFGWTLPHAQAPAVASAYLVGYMDSSSWIGMNQKVDQPGDTRIRLVASPQFDGNGKSCGNGKLPAFTNTTGARQLGTVQVTDRRLNLHQYSLHFGRPAN